MLIVHGEPLPGNGNAGELQYIIDTLSDRHRAETGAAAAFGKPSTLGGRATTLGGGYRAETGPRYGGRTGGYLAGPADTSDPSHQLYMVFLNRILADNAWKVELKWASDAQVLKKQDMLNGAYNYGSAKILSGFAGGVFLSPGRLVHIGNKRLIFKDQDGIIDAVLDHLKIGKDGKSTKSKKKSSGLRLADTELSFYPPNRTFTSDVIQMFRKSRGAHDIVGISDLTHEGDEKVFRRIFYRNGIPIDSFHNAKGTQALNVSNSRNYFLQPVGAFFEPNCQGHIEKISNEHIRILNESLLFTNDVVDILMNKTTIKELFTSDADLTDVGKWSKILNAAIESLKEGDTVGNCSVKFCEKLEHLFSGVSHFIPKPDTKFLVWTLPSFRGQEASTLCDISNPDCIHPLHAAVYKSIRNSHGGIPGHTLTKGLITHFLTEKQRDAGQFGSEPVYPIFEGITEDKKKKFDGYVIDEEAMKLFRASVYQRLFCDAYPFVSDRKVSDPFNASNDRSKYWSALPENAWTFKNVGGAFDSTITYHTINVPFSGLNARPVGAPSPDEMMERSQMMEFVLEGGVNTDVEEPESEEEGSAGGGGGEGPTRRRLFFR